jgi:hypothetical protein
MDRKQYSLLVAVVLLCGSSSFETLAQGEPTAPTAVSIDYAVVREKIGMLGVRDDSLSYDERPAYWLKQRRQHVTGELIAGLDHTERRVALGCLDVLKGVKDNPKLLDTLIRIARQKDHPIHVEATCRLCDYAEDERAHKLLDAAWRDEQRFKDARWRSRMAAAVGREAAAVELIVPLLRQDREYEVVKIIEQLGQVGHDSAIEPLEPFRQDRRWKVAAEAYQVLASIDPQGHGLTEGQVHFLQESSRGSKGGWQSLVGQWKELISLKRTEIYHLVLANIHTDRPWAGLVLLQLWQDKQASPALKELMEGKDVVWRWACFAAAYLGVEGTTRSIDAVIRDIRERSDVQFNDWARCCLSEVVESVMPVERKLAVLSAFREQISPLLVAYGLRAAGEDQAALLGSMLKAETDWRAVTVYIQIAAADEQKRYKKHVELVLDRFVETLEKNEGAISAILGASVNYSLPGTGKKIESLLSHPQMRIRIAAVGPAALLGGDRARALAILFESLGQQDSLLRKLSAEQLMRIPYLSEEEARERETIVLRHVGTASEDYALRVLITCAGRKTAQMLLPIMDEPDVQRALYAAWVLSQHPDEKVKDKGQRRVNLYKILRRQPGQAGSSIVFDIAPGLRFYQRSKGFEIIPGGSEQREKAAFANRDRYIPANLDEKEQEFSVRAYRHTLSLKNYHYFSIRGLWAPYIWDQSHLPLLEVIAQEDPLTRKLIIQDKPVVQYPRRREAARAIARIKSRKASHRDLSGDQADSEQMLGAPMTSRRR